MSDPYQPTEKVEKLTQKALHIIRQARRPMKKVGIFTRSPLVLRDIDLIAELPRGRVHFTASPYDETTREKLEPCTAPMHERWEAIRQLKAAGIRVHVNVAPFIPIASEYFISDFAEQLARLKVDEFYVDPMQCYSAAMKRIAADPPHSEWSKIEAIMEDRAAYKAWKKELHIKWTEAWKKVAHLSPDTMALSCDHETKMKINMSTGEWLDWKQYDQYEMRK
jgi:DNA repair photolyase